ncbi:MAG: c-type cytochrome, partial [Sphingobacteriales bacterium]
MKTKILKNLVPALVLTGITFLYACGGPGSASSADSASTAASADIDPAAKSDSKGVGRFTSVQLGPIDPAMAEKGQVVFAAKCAACHKTTDQKVVGPGLLG